MKLGLSSAAAPDASLDELVSACHRRGLAGIELVEGHGHGIGPGAPSTRTVRDASEKLRARGVPVIGFRVASSRATTEEIMSLLDALDAPAIVPEHLWEESGLEGGLRAHALHRASGRDAARSHEDRNLVWEVGEAGEPLGTEDAARVLDRFGPRIRQIRLHGGGPESATGEGLGVGPLLTRLALARFDGCLVLTPSTPLYTVAWSAWLGRRGGWGCGGAEDLDRELVQLSLPADRGGLR